MNGKEKVILTLIGEIHEHCVSNNICYYLSEKEKTAYSATLNMDAANMKKFLSTFKCDGEHRALEYPGNNHSLLGNHLRYIDLDTFYYTEDRMVRDIHLGMFIKIAPMSKSKSRWNRLDKYRKYTGFEGNEKRSALLNRISGAIHSSMIGSTTGKISKADITEAEIDGIRFYVKKGSAYCDDPEQRFRDMIVKKGNSELFICDETISYRDIDLAKDRKTLAEYRRKLQKPKIRYKTSEAKQGKVVSVSTASYARFCIATDLLQKYSYQEIIDRANEEPIREILDNYLAKAKKVRKKELSAYVGDEFTAVINAVYPEVDTDDLYKYTPELFYEGIRIYDYKGELIGVYGGRK